MYLDRLADRPIELEALTGALVTAGLRHRIPTPTNTVLLALLRSINEDTRMRHQTSA